MHEIRSLCLDWKCAKKLLSQVEKVEMPRVASPTKKDFPEFLGSHNEHWVQVLWRPWHGWALLRLCCTSSRRQAVVLSKHLCYPAAASTKNPCEKYSILTHVGLLLTDVSGYRATLTWKINNNLSPRIHTEFHDMEHPVRLSRRCRSYHGCWHWAGTALQPRRRGHHEERDPRVVLRGWGNTKRKKTSSNRGGRETNRDEVPPYPYSACPRSYLHANLPLTDCVVIPSTVTPPLL